MRYALSDQLLDKSVEIRLVLEAREPVDDFAIFHCNHCRNSLYLQQ